jgi:hypothetical protein
MVESPARGAGGPARFPFSGSGQLLRRGRENRLSWDKRQVPELAQIGMSGGAVTHIRHIPLVQTGCGGGCESAGPVLLHRLSVMARGRDSP